MLLLAVSTVALAQTKVTGRVVDESGEPIIGASVIQKGTNNGSVTDLDGNFTIPLPGKCILQISYVGYKTQTISYTGQNKLKITIKIIYAFIRVF